jgi:hypothetical protein
MSRPIPRYFPFVNQTLRALALLLLVCALTLRSGLAAIETSVSALAVPIQTSDALSTQDEEFLEDLERRSFNYFREQSDSQTGLVLDRARTDNSPHDERHRNVASIAATGFGLTALCIAAERGWIKADEARERVRSSLRFFAERAPHKRGWFYHWMDMRTGARAWSSEVSSIDTALLLSGILTTRQYFSEDAQIVQLATSIYERIDFPWMLDRHPTLLSHGWKPETGFLGPRWDTYSEDTSLYLLAIGSPTHPIRPRSWYALKRTRMSYGGYSYITTRNVPLFMHQYAHLWIDYRGRRETRGQRIDYFANSVAATRAHKAFCLRLAREFPKSYSENVWGITASDSVKGYVAWGGPPRDPSIDGTVVPTASGGSLQFTPDISLPALRMMKERFGERVYGRYGFVDAFNPTTNWVGPDIVGINVGPILLSAENLRTGNVWRWFMRNQEITRAMSLIGLEESGKAKANTQKIE